MCGPYDVIGGIPFTSVCLLSCYPSGQGMVLRCMLCLCLVLAGFLVDLVAHTLIYSYSVAKFSVVCVRMKVCRSLGGG